MKGRLAKFFGLFAGLLMLASCGDVNYVGKDNSKEKIDVSSI